MIIHENCIFCRAQESMNGSVVNWVSPTGQIRQTVLNAIKIAGDIVKKEAVRGR
jgi:hypothetical protein